MCFLKPYPTWIFPIDKIITVDAKVDNLTLMKSMNQNFSDVLILRRLKINTATGVWPSFKVKRRSPMINWTNWDLEPQSIN